MQAVKQRLRVRRLGLETIDIYSKCGQYCADALQSEYRGQFQRTPCAEKWTHWAVRWER